MSAITTRRFAIINAADRAEAFKAVRSALDDEGMEVLSLRIYATSDDVHGVEARYEPRPVCDECGDVMTLDPEWGGPWVCRTERDNYDGGRADN